MDAIDKLLASTGFHRAAASSATGLLHNVIIVKALLTAVLLIGASIVAAKYNSTRAGDLLAKTKIKYVSSLWFGQNTGLFGTLVILWLPTVVFYSVLLLMKGGAGAGAIGGLGIGTLTAVYLGFTVALLAITATMTALAERTTSLDRMDTLTYISQVFVGSHSGLLSNLFLLWAPFLVVLMLAGPINTLAPYQGNIAAAAAGLANAGQRKAARIATNLVDELTPLRAGRYTSPY